VARAFLGLGTNLGDRRAQLSRAVAALAEAGDLVAVSGLYETEPVGGPEQGAFLNLVVELDTADLPERLLERCRELEAAAERVRTVRWGPRTLDVDVLWVEGEVRSSEELTVPHPRMLERRFVLAPLAELAPELVPADRLASSVGSVTRIGTLDGAVPT
jgi:2-amino-4-hydroxy-6-hydroxymethyldihydropteridine diphosphokinase